MRRLDAPKIEQALNNLISNAVKFSPPGLTVYVRLERRDDCMLLAVSDSGQGLSAEARAKPFRPFVTFARSRMAGGEQGTGLDRIAGQCMEPDSLSLAVLYPER